MAADKLSFQSARPIDIAQELLAYQKYSSGAGDAFRDVGTTLDDFLKSKSTRDTAAFNLKAAGLPTPEARMLAYEQARKKFNLLDPAAVQKSLRAEEVHDFARTQREEQAAQAADLLLTQKGAREDIIADNLARDERNKQLAINETRRIAQVTEQMLLEDTGREELLDFNKLKFGKEHKETVYQNAIIAGQNDEKIAQTYEEMGMTQETAANELAFQKAKEETRKEEEKKKEDRVAQKFPYELERLEKAEEESDRKLFNRDKVVDDLAVFESVVNAEGIDAGLSQLQRTIKENEGLGISKEEQKALYAHLDRYITDDTSKVIDADITKAFGAGKKIDYTPNGQKRLEDAVFKRLLIKYKRGDRTTLRSTAVTIVANSEHGAIFANPLIESDNKMNAIQSTPPTPVMKKGEVDENATAKKHNKNIVAAYVKERANLVTHHDAEKVKAFDAQWRQSALNAADITLRLTSKKVTLLKNDDGTLILKTDPKTNKLVKTYSDEPEAIIEKPIDQISANDLKRYKNSVITQLEKMGFKDIRSPDNAAELNEIISRNETQFEGLSAKMTSAREFVADLIEIKKAETAQKIEQAKIPSKVRTKLTEKVETLKQQADSDGNAIDPATDSFTKYLDEGKERNGIDKIDIKNAVTVLDNVLQKRAKTLSHGERAHIIMNFMKAKTTVSTYAGWPEIILDWNESGEIETGTFGDQEVIDIDITSNAQSNKLFRMLMEDTGAKLYPEKTKQYVGETKRRNTRADNLDLITQNTNLIDHYTKNKFFLGMGGIPAGVQAQIQVLKDQIKAAEKENTSINTYFTSIGK